LNRIKGLTTIGFTDVLGLSVSAFFWFILATLVEPEEYGNIFYFLSISSMVSSIAPIASNYLNTVFSAKKIDILYEVNLLSAITTGIGGIVLYFITQRIDIAFLLIGLVCINLTTGKMLGEKNFRLYSITSLFQKFTTIIFGLSFYFLFGFESIIFALALSHVLHIILFFKDIRIKKYHFFRIKSRIKFILTNYSNELVGMFGGRVDKIVIGAMFGFTLLGHYSLVIQVIAGLMILPTIITKYLITEDLYGVKNNDFKKKIVIVSIIISLLGIFLVPEIIPHLFPKYLEVIEPIRIMSLSILPNTFARIQVAKYLSQERGQIIMVGAISYVAVLFAGIFTLVSSLGIIGLAISFVIGYVAQVMAHTIYNKKFPHKE
tara:strand:- start:1694 stop:2821 length:1128 start_codon:yes stop_codon:yes gene_type:complete